MLNQIHNNQIVLIVLDGWGYNSKYHSNAIKQAKTPTFDLLWNQNPKTLLHASGNHVGLPVNQMGNSEVGHTTIGAGRTINQELVRINKSIDGGAFFNNKVIQNIYQTATKNKKKMHLIGLCSNGGVHSHIKHLIALIEISKRYQNLRTCIHLITDGRDTKPQQANYFIHCIENYIKHESRIEICTISGRYYSMDRDCRWQRTEKAYNCLIHNIINKQYYNSSEVIIDHYKKKIYDEFIPPTRIKSGKIEEGDSIILFNFRPDRMRQLIQALCDQSFEGFKTKQFTNLNIATFTTYDNKLKLPTIFSKIPKNNFLGQIISQKGFNQFRLAETEKYAHVTYFFNGGRESPFPGEYRELISSPTVDQYDSTPEMSAKQITLKLTDIINSNRYKFILANYSNPDMVGHTGNFLATKQAIEVIDSCLNQLLNNIKHEATTIIITADHGNADIMLDQNNEPCKSHTNNLVPFVIIQKNNPLIGKTKKQAVKLRVKGSLADVAPTILDLLNIEQPINMDGQSLIHRNNKLIKANKLPGLELNF